MIAKNTVFDCKQGGGGGGKKRVTGGSFVSENFVRERLDAHYSAVYVLLSGNLQRVERFAGTGPLI